MQRLERDLDLIDVMLNDFSTLEKRMELFSLDKERFCDDRSDNGELAYDAVMSPVY